MHTIELDFAHDCDHTRDSQNLAQRHGCSVRLLKEFGPAGGNPLYQFTGTRLNLVSMLSEFCQDRDTLNHQLTRIRNT
jgi:hypothetical protein